MIRPVIRSTIRSVIRSSIGVAGGNVDASILVNDSFTTSLPAGWTFTRTGGQVYEDSSGVLQTAATNTPAFNYSAASAQGIYLEGARTNILTYSQQFNDAIWSKTRVSVVANTTVAPDGATTADDLIDTTDNNNHNSGQFKNASSSTARITGSVFLKQDELRYAQVRVIHNAGNTGGSKTDYDVVADLQTGAITDTGNLTGTPSGTHETIYSVGDWRRVSLGLTKAGDSNRTDLTIYTWNSSSHNSNPVYIGSGTDCFNVWQAQIEEGGFASSPILTTSASAARNATSLTSSVTFPDNGISGQIKATVKFEHDDYKGASDVVLLDLSDGTDNNYLRVSFDATNDQIHLTKRVSGGTVVTASTTATNLSYAYDDELNIRFRANDTDGISLKVNSEAWVDVSTGDGTTDWSTLLDEAEIRPAFVCVPVLKLYGESKSDAFLEAL